MNSFNFESSVCTSREQSERLLALGLKKETADMCHRTNGMGIYFITTIDPLCNPNDIPAWSLGRLIKDLMPQSIGHLELAIGSDYVGYYEECHSSAIGMYWEYAEETPDMFNNIISTIEWLIKKGYFPKEYLV